MHKRPKVLVTGSGGAASQSIVKSLNLAGGYEIITTDVDPLMPGIYRGDKGFLVHKNWSKYIQELITICKDEKIDILIPGSDIELEHISAAKKEIEKNRTVVLISSPEAIEIGNNKLKTAEFLSKTGHAPIFTYSESDLIKLNYDIPYPALVKPSFGWASLHVYTAKNKEELKAYCRIIASDGYVPLAQEYMGNPEEEYTTGVYLSRDGEVLATLSLWRYLRKGNSIKAKMADDPKLTEEMISVARHLKTVGPVNLQCRKSNGKYYVFEINTRFSGTTIIQANIGVNGPDMLVRNFLYGDKPKPEKLRDLIGMMYLNYVFVDQKDYNVLKKEGHITKTGYADKWF